MLLLYLLEPAGRGGLHKPVPTSGPASILDECCSTTLVTVTVMTDSAGFNDSSLRVDVAAGYRLLSLYGFSDLTDGFVAARRGDDVLIGGYGLLPELATASALHRRSLRSTPALEKHGGVDVDALRFCAALLGSRADWNALIHAHPPASLVFSALECTIEPISQWSVMFYDKVGYIPFEVDVSNTRSCQRLAELADQGVELVVLKNHGVLVPGTTVADAFHRLYRIEQAFRIQLAAMSTGVARTVHSLDDTLAWQKDYWGADEYVDNDGSREWSAWLARLDAIDPSFRA
jgi:ribulose-5-phosphate 4-epimerase/fuculose-1-phosphate aldolase